MSKVAVIGGGPLGLASVKNFSEEGFDVTGFDAREHLGGLWKYSTDDSLSCQETTVFNSSRYRSAFTDFGFDESVGDFPKWQDFYKYLNQYADHFAIREKYQLGSRIEDVSREGGKWKLTIKDVKSGQIRHEYFDKCAIANGYFTSPKVPKIEGVEKFEGPKVHSINFHHPEQYDGKNVLLVGLHATAADVCTMLVGHAKQCYLSHRNGLYMVSRYGPDHKVFDAAQSMGVTKVLLALMTYAPRVWNWAFDKLIAIMSKKSFPNMPKSWNFYPAPPAYVTNPLIGDDIYKQMESGWAKPVPAIKRFTGPKSMEFTDGTTLDDIDAVVYCTGYDASVNFLKGDLNPYRKLGEQGNFYRNLFLLHPDKAIRESLVFIGHGGFAWPGLSLFEMQSVAVAQIWKGKSTLPPLDEMKQWHANLLEYRKNLFASNPYESTHYPAMLPTAEQLTWLDRTCGSYLLDRFSWFSWKSWQFWWQDREFYKLCSSGVLSPAMWRLFDNGKMKAWDGARERIKRDNVMCEEGAARRKALVERMEGEGKKVV